MKARSGITVLGRDIVLSDVSRRTGISVAHLSNILAGRRNPSIGVIRKLCADTGINIADFVIHISRRTNVTKSSAKVESC